MTQNTDLCPISDTGNHRYFIFKVVEVFEPYTGTYSVAPLGVQGPLYEKVEYAVSGCNCGSAVKQRVKQQ
jgi:hypothetical protein